MGSTLLMCPTASVRCARNMRISLLASSDVQYYSIRRELKWGVWDQMNLTQAFGDGGIVAAVDGHVGLLTISNARRRNALNSPCGRVLTEATNWLASQDARAIILQGDGGVDFSPAPTFPNSTRSARTQQVRSPMKTPTVPPSLPSRGSVPVVAKCAASASAADWAGGSCRHSRSAMKPAASPFLPASWVWPIRRMRWPILWRRSVRRLQGLPCSRQGSFRRQILRAPAF